MAVDTLARSIDACQYDQVKLLQEIDDCCAPLLSAPLEEADAETLSQRSGPGRPGAAAPPEPRSRPVPKGGVRCDLTAPIGLSQPTVSHHLKVLHEAGLLERERRGKWVLLPGSTGTACVAPLGSSPPDPLSSFASRRTRRRSRRGSDAPRPVALPAGSGSSQSSYRTPGKIGQASPHPIVITTSLVRPRRDRGASGRSAERSIPTSAIASTTAGFSRSAGSASRPTGPEPARPRVARATPPRSAPPRVVDAHEEDLREFTVGRARHRSTR